MQVSRGARLDVCREDRRVVDRRVRVQDADQLVDLLVEGVRVPHRQVEPVVARGAEGVRADAHPALEPVGVVPDVAAPVEVEDLARPDVEVLHGREERRRAARQRRHGADVGADRAGHEDAFAHPGARALDLEAGQERLHLARAGQRQRRAARELCGERDRVDAEHAALDLLGALARLACPAGRLGELVEVVRGQLDAALHGAQLRDAGIPRVGVGPAALVDPPDDQARLGEIHPAAQSSHALVEEVHGVPDGLGSRAHVAGEGESALAQQAEDRA